jgi:uncharacterized protein YkwD
MATPAAAKKPSLAKERGTALIELINETRAKHGLHALREAPSLNRSARRHSGYMLGADSFGHLSRIRASSRFTTLGEILAMHFDWRPRIGYTLRRWLHSPGHRSLALSSQFRYVGAGMARGNYGGRLATAWTVQFGNR